MGGSLGLAIKKKGLASKVIGIGRHQHSINEALKSKAIDEGYLGLRKIDDVDLVILAAPVREIIKSLPELSKFFSREAVVIDVGSTKSEIIQAADKSGLEFIGCHPLAGSQNKGVQNAKSSLFENSLCLLVPAKKVEKAALNKIEKFWKSLGARTRILDAATHDRILAFISHLPHAVVFSLIDCIRPDYLSLAASGLKDTTRIGLSDAALWRDIFLTNPKELLEAIKIFKQSLRRLESLIKSGQPKELEFYLEKAKKKRNGF